MNLRRAARGRECLLRIPGICSFNPAQSVLAHIRRAAGGGIGFKPIDECGIVCCHPCHEWMGDGQDDAKAADILDGLLRTLALWKREGFL